MRYLRNLRHLCLEECTKLNEMPSKIRELTCLKTLSLFIVGPKSNKGNQLEELQCLNLGGRLEIRHLERVENHINAKKANLAKKKNLRQLILVWESNSKSKSSEDMDEKVLESLKPHPNLESLSVKGFRGRCFPVWMVDLSLEKIVKLKITDCKNCLRLPQLGKLPHLKFLSLKNLGVVEYIVEDEVIEGGNPVTTVLFPSLETLELSSLPNLKGLLKEQVITRDEVFPNLRKLRIKYCCSSLILPPLSSLRKLKAMNCSSATLASLSKLDTLTSLTVVTDNDENMKSCIPIEKLENLSNLKSLQIYGAQELISVPEQGLLRGLTSLTELGIYDNKTLTCLPQGWLPHLTALERLWIGNCLELVELPEEIKYIHNLKLVALSRLPNMVCLPKALRHISSSLRTLYLNSLDQLESLPDWLDHLTSLQSLHLWFCPKLVSLPACIRGLPNLQRLNIVHCPELAKRCESITGEDWHKIAHIPLVQIPSKLPELDSSYIPSL